MITSLFSFAACQLLGEYLETVKRDIAKAFQIFETNCVQRNYSVSCNKAGHYKIIGSQDVPADPVRFLISLEPKQFKNNLIMFEDKPQFEFAT